MGIRNAKYDPRAGYISRRDARFVTQGSEAKVSTKVRRSAKSINADITLSTKLAEQRVILSSLSQAVRRPPDWMVSSGTTAELQQLAVAKSLAFQQVPRPSINLAGVLEKYRLKDGKTVLLFLNEHRNVANFLIESHEEIRKYFSSNSLRLRVSQDPEDPHLKMLVLSIATTLDEVDESYEKFNSLEDEWFLNASSELGDRLCIKLDFE